MSHSHAEIRKHMRTYIAVFGALAVFTVLTVAASYMNVSHGLGVTIALAIATVKASLVAAVFMHLKWERGISIWWSLALCAVFFIALMLLPVLTQNDEPPQVYHGIWE